MSTEAQAEPVSSSKLRPTNHLELVGKSINHIFKTKEQAEKFIVTPEAKGMVMEKVEEDSYIVGYEKNVKDMIACRNEAMKESLAVRNMRASMIATARILQISVCAMKDSWNAKYNDLRKVYDEERQKYPELFKDKKVEEHLEQQMEKTMDSLCHLNYKDVKVTIFQFGEVLFRLNEVQTIHGWREEDRYSVEFRIQFLKTKKRTFTVRFNCLHHFTHKFIVGSGRTAQLALAGVKKALDWESNRIHKDAQQILAYIEDFGYYGKLYIHSEKKISKPVGDFCKQLHFDMIRIGNCNTWNRDTIKLNLMEAETVLATLQNPEPDDKQWMEGIIKCFKSWLVNYSKKTKRK